VTDCTVIELNDAGLALYRGENELLVSPACALVTRDTLKVGDSAYREARLKPHLAHTQFWTKLSMDPLPQPGHRARNYADLAYAHLAHLWERGGVDDGDVILAVPSSFGREQLGLLLGIARECPFNPVGLVDSAVAAAADLARSGPILHVDLHLQRAIVTLMRANATVELESLEEVPALGIASLHDAWIALIADLFIRETRFDPLHSAESEQSIYNELPRWLQGLHDAPDVVVEITASGSPRRISLPRARLIEHVQARYDALVTALSKRASALGEVTVLVSHRVSMAPGLAAAIAAIPGLEVLALQSDAAVRGALARANEIRSSGEALAFVTRLSASDAQRPAELVPKAPATRARPTHLLWGHEAYALEAGSVPIGGEGGLVRTVVCPAQLHHDAKGTALVNAAADLRVNGEPASAGQELYAGDRIQFQDHEFYMISVAGHGA
jgi:hypothetical protein